MHLCIIYIALYNKKLLFMHAFKVFFVYSLFCILKISFYLCGYWVFLLSILLYYQTKSYLKVETTDLVDIYS